MVSQYAVAPGTAAPVALRVSGVTGATGDALGAGTGGAGPEDREVYA